MRSSTLAIVVGSVGIAAILTAAIATADSHGLKVITNWVNFGGAALTFVGLVWASLRTNNPLRAWFRNAWHRLRVGPRTITMQLDPVSVCPIMGELIGYVTISFSAIDQQNPDAEAQLRARTDRLLIAVNSLEQQAASALVRIARLEGNLTRARAEARKGDRETREHAEATLQQFADNLQQSERLDLRWAIAGTFFQAFGAVLSFTA